MSLNWKEINYVLSELDLEGAQIQRVSQSAYDILHLQIRCRGKTRILLIALSPGACRLHETFRTGIKAEKPLRFAEFCKSRIVNGRIEGAEQLGDNRIVRILIRRGESRYRFYVRLWSNAANCVVTDETGRVLDAMRRSPKRGEISGGRYAPEETLPRQSGTGAEEYVLRDLDGEGSFNERIDRWYTEHGGALSLDALREQARKSFEGSMGRIAASLEKLRAKAADYGAAEKLREYGDIIMAGQGSIRGGDEWLETENFYTGKPIRIRLDPQKSPAASAEGYYEAYKKAKKGLAEVEAEIAAGEAELKRLKETLKEALEEPNPLRLHRLIKTRGSRPPAAADAQRPGLSFRRKEWLIMVGRDAAENDELLRKHVRGNDLWLHVRDYPGSYVFIKGRAGKSVPLDILLDAGNLALFYSKGRGNGGGDLFYTPVKFLRRVKNGKRGQVIPTQEKNLHIRLDGGRLKELERCRVEKS
jgi:predicted ribosome quality control (RQC) complex YloA/Tae2 family protein